MQSSRGCLFALKYYAGALCWSQDTNKQ